MHDCRVRSWDMARDSVYSRELPLEFCTLQGSRCDEEITSFWIILRRVVKLSSLKLFNP